MGAYPNSEYNRQTVDLAINKPRLISVANCIKRKYDVGVSNLRSDSTGVIEKWT